RGQFELLRDEISTNPDRKPDFGEARIHPTAGATVVGARKPLIAYNINLNTSDVAIAKYIAKRIRFSSGGCRDVQGHGRSAEGSESGAGLDESHGLRANVNGNGVRDRTPGGRTLWSGCQQQRNCWLDSQ